MHRPADEAQGVDVDPDDRGDRGSGARSASQAAVGRVWSVEDPERGPVREAQESQSGCFRRECSERPGRSGSRQVSGDGRTSVESAADSGAAGAAGGAVVAAGGAGLAAGGAAWAVTGAEADSARDAATDGDGGAGTAGTAGGPGSGGVGAGGAGGDPTGALVAAAGAVSPPPMPGAAAEEGVPVAAGVPVTAGSSVTGASGRSSPDVADEGADEGAVVQVEDTASSAPSVATAGSPMDDDEPATDVDESYGRGLDGRSGCDVCGPRSATAVAAPVTIVPSARRTLR